jgi:hypothetical protein
LHASRREKKSAFGIFSKAKEKYMKLYQLKKYKLTATIAQCKDGYWIDGTFGPFRFEAYMEKCEECEKYVAYTTTIWREKGKSGQKSYANALHAIESRFAQTQVIALREGEKKQITL